MNAHRIPVAVNPEENVCRSLPIRQVSNAEEIRPLLSGLSFFAGMPDRHFDILASLAMQINFERGQYIFKMGEVANRFYVILEGKVQLESPLNASNVHALFAGDELGWSWLFEPHVFNSSARVIASARTIFFYGTILRQYCEEDQNFGCDIMRRVGRVMIKDWIAERKLVHASGVEPETF